MKSLHQLLLAVFLIASSAVAQPAVQSQPNLAPMQSLADLLSLRLRYGFVVRKGYQEDPGPGLTYNGVTPNDFGLATAFFGSRRWGASVSLQREGFSLQATKGSSTNTALWRAHLGPAARFDLGPVRVDALAGYAFAQLPVLPDSAPSASGQPLFSVGNRHAMLLASRGLISALPLGMFAEASVEVPIGFSAQAPDGSSASSSGFAAGCAIGIPLGRTDRVSYAIALDYQYLWDRLGVSKKAASYQSLSRVGLSLEFILWERLQAKGLPSPAPPASGGVAITLLDKETAQPVTQANVVVREVTYHPSAAGTIYVPDLEAGALRISVEAPDYQPARENASIDGGKTEQLAIALVRYSPKSATLSGLIRSTRGKRVSATLEIPENNTKTQADPNGAFLLQLPNGTYHVVISAPGYITQTKQVTLSEGDQAIFNVELHPR
jgi:hypothetical protein